MMWEWHSGWAWWWMGGMVLFWGLVALVIVLIARQSRTENGRGGAQRILDERFAKGEIDDAEYRRRSGLIRT